jgi:tetratricopeptide (TPR) repeat protein
MEKHPKAIAVFQSVAMANGQDTSTEARALVARARLNLGTALGQSGRHESAVLEFAGIDLEYAADPDPVTREMVAHALYNRGIALSMMGRTREAIDILDSVRKRYGDAGEFRTYTWSVLAKEARTALSVGQVAAPSSGTGDR